MSDMSLKINRLGAKSICSSQFQREAFCHQKLKKPNCLIMWGIYVQEATPVTALTAVAVASPACACVWERVWELMKLTWYIPMNGMDALLNIVLRASIFSVPLFCTLFYPHMPVSQTNRWKLNVQSQSGLWWAVLNHLKQNSSIEVLLLIVFTILLLKYVRHTWTSWFTPLSFDVPREPSGADTNSPWLWRNS